MKFCDRVKKTAVIFLAVLMLVPSAAAAELMDESPDGEEVDAAVFAEGEIAITAEGIAIPAPSAILMEKETGKVLFEKNPDEKLEPASVTKVMTILLIVEAVESGAISLGDTVTVSTYASTMGGSQVFLREGEQMSAKEMLKCVVVSSANDAAVALAEHIAGSEEAFVQRMNQRAAELGMENTLFKNCTGLFDDKDHLTTARDIAIMSRELIKHEWIKEYTTIWMDTIRNGEFGLSNTNKLIYYYDGSTGLKTGFTRSAGYCLSATAERNGVEYIAVVMHCSNTADRFESAKTLLSYGFANYTLIPATPDDAIAPIEVALGENGFVQPVLSENKKALVNKSTASSVTKKIELAEKLTAPVAEGQKIGMLSVLENDRLICQVDIIAADAVAKVSWWDLFAKMLGLFFGRE